MRVSREERSESESGGRMEKGSSWQRVESAPGAIWRSAACIERGRIVLNKKGRVWPWEAMYIGGRAKWDKVYRLKVRIERQRHVGEIKWA